MPERRQVHFQLQSLFLPLNVKKYHGQLVFRLAVFGGQLLYSALRQFAQPHVPLADPLDGRFRAHKRFNGECLRLWLPLYRGFSPIFPNFSEIQSGCEI